MNLAFANHRPARIRLLTADGRDTAGAELLVARLACAGGGGGGEQPDLYKEYYGELLAKSQMAPAVYGTEAEFDPAYAALNMNVLNDTLFGTNNLPVNTPSFAQGVNPSYANFPNVGQPIGGSTPAIPSVSYPSQTAGTGTGNKNTQPNSAAPASSVSLRGGVSAPQASSKNNQPTQTATGPAPVQTVSSPGLMDIINRAAAPLSAAQNAATTSTRTANVADLMKLGPGAVAAANAADPANARLLASMTGEAQRGMDLGSNLDPGLSRLATQGVLAGRQGMLGGTGNAGDYATALGLSSFGQNLKSLRQQYAGNVFNQRGSYYGSTINSMMNGGNVINPLASTQGVYNMSQGGPRLFGSDINAQQTYSDALNASNAQSIASANNSAALTGAGISAGVGIGGAAIIAF